MSHKRRSGHRYWKVWDLVGLFNDHAKGRIPFQCVTNHNMEEPFEFFSVKLDPAWPDGVPDSNRDVEAMKYNIESDVPVPSIHRGDGLRNNLMETMSAMEKGQSFFVPLRHEGDKVARMQMVFIAAKKSYPGKMFVSRKESDAEGKDKGLRVWRVE